MNPSFSCPEILEPARWRALREAHRDRLEPVLGPAKKRRSTQQKDPVEDFLFTYYSFRPSLLARWTPGLHRYLADGAEYLLHPHFAAGPWGVGLHPDRVPATRRAAWRDLLALLEATQARPPFFGCLGLHEWAMVHDAADIRHGQIPLRLSHAETRRVVETLPVRCSHFDAFRHFSRSARALNQWQPGPGDRAAFEQPGCIHANMDVYRHAYKLYPWGASALLADAFLFARRARIVDMRASPYDARALGLEPIEIETPAGQAAYREAQRALAEEAAPLRQRLIEEIRGMLALTEPAAAAQTADMQGTGP